MEPETVQRLLHINQEFYQTFAKSFSDTRQRIQPGVLKAIDEISPAARVLDLGCGNGLLANELATAGHNGAYIGIDSSDEMLAEARNTVDHPQARFIRAEFINDSWATSLSKPFDLIFAFAVLHHIPGVRERERWLFEIRKLINAEGTFSFSNWNFLSSTRLRDRMVPWNRVDLSASDVESGDYLLDWRRDGVGLRYVHAFESGEIEALLSTASFEVNETYFSDGENGTLGSYYIARPV
jgi:tRNA (uracil-5-)-methyltransferase TRM9